MRYYVLTGSYYFWIYTFYLLCDCITIIAAKSHLWFRASLKLIKTKPFSHEIFQVSYNFFLGNVCF